MWPHGKAPISMRKGFKMLYSNSREEMAKTSGFTTSICIDGLNPCRKVTFNKRLKLFKDSSNIQQKHALQELREELDLDNGSL